MHSLHFTDRCSLGTGVVDYSGEKILAVCREYVYTMVSYCGYCEHSRHSGPFVRRILPILALFQDLLLRILPALHFKYFGDPITWNTAKYFEILLYVLFIHSLSTRSISAVGTSTAECFQHLQHFTISYCEVRQY